MRKNRGRRLGVAVSLLAVAAVVGWRLLAQPLDVTLPTRSDFCRPASTSSRPLAEVRNTRDANFDCLRVAVGHGVIRALQIESHNFSPIAGQGQVERVKTIEIVPADVERGEGVVLDGALGHDAIILRGLFSADRRQAKLEMSFLYNGLTGEYRRCTFAVEGSGDSWRLIDAGDKPVDRIVIRTRQFPLLGTIGIANLDGVCPN